MPGLALGSFRTTRSSSPRESGFTLIETLVALIILAAAYLLIQQTLSIGSQGLRSARAEAQAIEIAQARLAAAGVDAPLQEGQQAGQTAGYDWTMYVRRYEPPRSGFGDEAGRGQIAAFWVAVAVAWREGPLQRLHALQLSTIKLSAHP
jgi:general secretion pathway protein I